MKKLLVVLLALGLFVHATGPVTRDGGRAQGQSTLFVDVPHAGDTSSAGDTIYYPDSGINFDGGDYTGATSAGTNVTMHGLFLTYGAGDVSIKMAGGGEMTVEVVVDSGYPIELFRGWRIVEIDSALTTFNGGIYPLF